MRALHAAVANALGRVEINDGESWTHEHEEIRERVVRFRLCCWLDDTTRDAEPGAYVEPQNGRWWYIEQDGSVDTAHIVRTIWLAYQTFMHHEMLERFRFDGNLIFNPHFQLSGEPK